MYLVPLCRLSLKLMQEGRNAFIKKEAEQNIQHTFDKSKRQVKDKQRFFHASHRGKNQLIHGKNGLFRHKIIIEGVYHKKVGRVGNEGHGHGAKKGSKYGSLLFFFF